MEHSWWPHIERLLIFASTLGVGLGLYLYNMLRDKSLDLRFITRDDFRRVEAKLDTVLAMAAYTAADRKGILTKQKPSLDKM